MPRRSAPRNDNGGLPILPKKYRLTSDYDFLRLRRIGRTYRSPFFSVSIAPNKEIPNPRFGFIVSTKLDKRAVARNRVKRVLREAVRNRLEKFPPGYDVVFILQRTIIGKSYEEVSAALNKVLSEISFP